MINKNKRSLIVIMIILVIVAAIMVISFVRLNSRKTKTSYQGIEKNEIVEEPEDTYIIDISNSDENIVEEQNSVITNVNNNSNKTNNKMPYYIKVNYEAQVVIIYSKDEQGNYTNAYKSMICSTGISTPKSGVYTIPGRWRWGFLQGNVYGQYVTKITGNILFHSVPYQRQDPSSLEYWEYDKLGTDASLGCVRLRVQDAKWIYENCANGTKVEFYSSPNAGPLAKPLAKKISDYPDYLRNWDPTDPNPSNPWLTYREETNNEPVNKPDNIIKNEEVNENTNKNETTSENENEIVNENASKNETENKNENITDNENKNEIVNENENETANNDI